MSVTRTIVAVTVGLWLLCGVATAATIWLDENAINAALGIGFWAVIGTCVSVAALTQKGH